MKKAFLTAIVSGMSLVTSLAEAKTSPKVPTKATAHVQKKSPVAIPKEKEILDGSRDALAAEMLGSIGIKTVLDDTGNKIKKIIINDRAYQKFQVHLFMQTNPKLKKYFTYHLKVHFGKKLMEVTYKVSPKIGEEECTIYKGQILCGDRVTQLQKQLHKVKKTKQIVKKKVKKTLETRKK